MKTLKNKPAVIHPVLLVVPLLVLILAISGAGCAPQPTETAVPTQNTPLPTLTSLPALTATPTFELLDHGLQYMVVGLYPDGYLPLYLEPTLSSEIIRQIPPTVKSIPTTGSEVNSDGITWLQIVYQESGGWVDKAYLARQSGDIPEEVVAVAHMVVAALKTADYQRLSDIIHPELCLRFSPYPYLRESDLTFCPEQLAGLPGSNTQFTWGRYDGSGETIDLTFDEYHQRFVYDQDYYQPDVVGLDQEVSSGNAINNISDIFPDGMIVEYHFPGFDSQYAGMDWRSLRLVFAQEKGGWFLVALVHGEWTI